MRRAVLPLALIVVTCLAIVSWADEPAPAPEAPPVETVPPALGPEMTPAPPPRPRFSVDLAAGYTPLPMLDYRYNLARYTDRAQTCDSDDESTLEANGIYGLSFAYYPPDDWIALGLVVEGLYAQYRGELTGRANCPSSFTRTYRFDQTLNFYQLNGLVRIYLARAAVRPFVEIGLGALRIDASFDAYDQTVYGLTGLTGWGVEWSITRSFGLSVQARLADHFGVIYHYEPHAGDEATIEAQYIPLSALLKTHFYF